MANRFQDLIDQSPQTVALPGVNRFSDLVNQPTTNRFADLITPQESQDGLLKKTIKSFGGKIGAVGRALSVGQQAVTGALEKGLEKVGILKNTDISGLGIEEGIKKQKSNIELVKRIGQETQKPDSIGGYLTANYTPSTSVFGNFVKELPGTAIGLAGDLFLDPLVFASKLGLVGKGTKAIGTGIAEGAKVLAEEIPAVQKVGDFLGRAFLTRYGQSEAFKTLDIGRKIKESLAVEKVGKLVSDVIEKPAVIQQRITQILKGEDEISQVVQKIAPRITKPLAQEAEITRVGNNILKNNPGITRKDAEAMARDVIKNRKFNNQAVKGTDNLSSISRAKAPGQSFDEWVKGQGKTVYHGTDSSSAEIINKSGFAGKKGGDTGLSFTANKKIAQEFAEARARQRGTKPVVLEADISGVKNASYNKFVEGKENEIFIPVDEIRNIKTRSQLKAEWEGVREAVVTKLDITDNELKILAEPIREELDRVGESISKLNPKLLSEETFQANKGTYFPRLYTDYEFPATEEGIIKQAFGFRAVSIPKEPFKKRILTEAESLAKGTRIEEAGFPALKRLTQLNITEQRQKFFKETAKLATDDPKPGWLQLSEDKALGDLAGKFLPAAEYKAIAEIRRIPGQVEQIYNKALATWKTFKTAYNPATISRNDLTNFFILNPLGGVGPHRLDIYAKTANQLISKGPLYEMARKEGLEISSQQAAELTQKASNFYQANKGLVSQFFTKIGDFHNTVKNFYGSQDKFFKLANFIKGVTEDGLTPQKALQRANFYLVDYSEVPEAINWLKKSPIGIPFISFTYGVLKPLAKTLLERPDKLSAYFKILSGIQQMNPMGETPQQRQAELDVTPDWIQQGTTLRLPFQDKYERGQYVNLQYILPFNILESKGLTPSSPLLTMMASALTNKDTFTGKDITMQTDTDQEKIAKWSTYFIRQIVPSLAPFGFSFEKIKALLQKRPDANGYVREALPVLIDVLGGIKITPIDQTVEGQKRAYEKRKQLEELRSNLIRIQTDKTILSKVKIEETKKVQEKINKVFQ